MYRLLHLFRTSIGSKLVVAATGLLLLTFLIGHMVGNLKVFQGAAALNEYAAWLQGHPLLWVLRLGILAIFVVHVLTTVRLARENRAARPTRYVRHAQVQLGLAARFMLASGLLILAFLGFHLLHLTLGEVGPAVFEARDRAGRPDVYARVVAGFQRPWLAATYLVAMGLLGVHLWHAVASLFQTLGFNHESYQALLRVLAPGLALVVVLGFAAVPFSVWLGWVD